MNFKTLIILIISACFLFSYQILYAAKNNLEDYKVSVKVGSCKVEPGYFETSNDGQLYIQVENDFELRLKQNSAVSVLKNPLALTDELELKKGIIGLKVASDTLLIKTTFGDIRLRNATVTIKLSEHMVRLCVNEGTAIFIKKANFVPVNAGSEIASSKDKLSSIYKYLDDLHYVWYWKPFEEEPSLRE